MSDFFDAKILAEFIEMLQQREASTRERAGLAVAASPLRAAAVRGGRDEVPVQHFEYDTGYNRGPGIGRHFVILSILEKEKQNIIDNEEFDPGSG